MTDRDPGVLLELVRDQVPAILVAGAGVTLGPLELPAGVTVMSAAHWLERGEWRVLNASGHELGRGRLVLDGDTRGRQIPGAAI